MTDHTNPKNQLDLILNKLCQNVDIPQTPKQPTQVSNELLIEQLEINNYPFQMLQCTHLEEKNIGEDCVECQYSQYETYKSRFNSFADEKGYTHTHTLKAAFDLYYSSLITQYRLTEADELIDKVYDACLSRGPASVYYISAIQARAFLRFKQGKYQESLDYFKQLLEVQGPSEVIYENMALVYVQLDQPQEAINAYGRAILLIRQKPIEQQKMSTLLISMANVIDEPMDAMFLLKEGLKLLRERYDKPHSLMAKTLEAMGDLNLKINNIEEAAVCFEEATQIFIDTCGLETPLTSKAMHKYASCLYQLNQKEKALETFINSLTVWTKVDNQSFKSNLIVQALTTLNAETLSPVLWEKTKLTLDSLEKKLLDPYFKNDLDTLCLFKFINELYIHNHAILNAKQCCKMFIECLNKMNEIPQEHLTYRDQFLQDTLYILALIETIQH